MSSKVNLFFKNKLKKLQNPNSVVRNSEIKNLTNNSYNLEKKKDPNSVVRKSEYNT